VTLEFARLPRAVRQTHALEARFDAEDAALAERLAAERRPTRRTGPSRASISADDGLIGSAAPALQ